MGQFSRIAITRKHVTTCLLACLCPLFFAACASVQLDAPKPITKAAASPDSPLSNIARNQSKATKAGNQSSFALLNNGNEALGARLRLIEAAEHTLDLQYFLMKPDLGGALITQALLNAADRGVRVRFLLDDVFTTVDDKTLGLLNNHPNIALRIFNPVMRPGPKFMGFINEFPRINRRMHNKSFTADGAFAVVGGRNIADEYYQINTTSEFADFDMLVIGRTVAEISKAFDLFWNDGWSVPMDRLRKAPSKSQFAQARSELDTLLKTAQTTYQAAINDPYFTRLDEGREPIYKGHAQVVTDTPDKLKVPLRDGEHHLAEALLGRIKNAKSDVLLLTPYFVPENYGARLFAETAARGVRVRIVTNSLAATNHAYVHAGYRRHRETLLKAGVDLYEIRTDALQVLGLAPQDSETNLVMHTKLAVIDGHEIFVGSLNLDPRSIKQNSELGLFIDSPPMARKILGDSDRNLLDYTFRLSLQPDNQIAWHYDNPIAPQTLTTEPGASGWKKFVVGFTELLGVELQL